jgi:hypothetical protein
MLYSNTANQLDKVTPNTTTTKKFLSQTGTGTAGLAPTWAQPAATDITGLATSATTDTTNADNITSGTLANARTTATASNGASTIIARDVNGSFSANLGAFVSVSGDGSAVTSLNATALASGTVPTARLGSGTANNTTFLRGDQTFVAISGANDGTLTMNVSGTGLTGSASFTANQSSGSTFTVASNATDANGASTIVARDASGNFSANTITAALSGTATSATTATNQSGGTVSATTGSFSGQVSVPQSASVGVNGINLNANGSGYLRGTANDTATSAQANVQLMSWFGIGFSPSITGQAVPQGENAVWIDARSGALSARNNITAYASDERLKQNFKPIENALDKLDQISGYVFDWDVDLCFSLGFAPTQKHEHGLKAQEIQKVVPDAVTLAPFDVDRDENGNDFSRSGKDYLTVRYDRLVPLLLESIKELKKEIELLKAK